MTAPRIPENLIAIETYYHPDLTYRLDFENKRIIGMVDGDAAAFQAIRKVLNTKRYAHAIYDNRYGQEFDGLIGKDPDFVRADFPNRAEDAIYQDDRVVNVSDYEFENLENGGLRAAFFVTTQSGQHKITTEI